MNVAGVDTKLANNKIAFNLKNTSDVIIGIYDIVGRKVANITRAAMGAGEHSINVDAKKLGIPSGNYVYQLVVIDTEGTYKQHRIIRAD